MKIDIPIFIPSYHRPDNIKTMNYFLSIGYPADLIHVFIDDEADDAAEYEANVVGRGCNLHIFNIEKERKRFDFVHRASVSRRAAGMSRNSFYDYAKENGIDFFIMQDDDTQGYQIKRFGKYLRKATSEDVISTFLAIREMMERRRMGLFGLSQTGDIYGIHTRLFRPKVMNTTFVNARYITRGEKGVQDDDTSQFVNIYNEGLFCGSLGDGVILSQMPSATQKGGLTDLYRENKLLNKALVTPIQFPSAIHAERQKKNGDRLHHRVSYRYLKPVVLRGGAERQYSVGYISGGCAIHERTA